MRTALTILLIWTEVACFAKMTWLILSGGPLDGAMLCILGAIWACLKETQLQEGGKR